MRIPLLIRELNDL